MVLNTQLISGSAPDSHLKLLKFAIGPDTNSTQLIEVAFRVFNNREVMEPSNPHVVAWGGNEDTVGECPLTPTMVPGDRQRS